MTDTYLGIDTSNYTTSLALCGGGKIIKSVRRLLPVKQGECGLRQSDAVFLHTKALPELSEELFSSELFVPGKLERRRSFCFSARCGRLIYAVLSCRRFLCCGCGEFLSCPDL